eukprot:5944874-Amphidinium_carterae.1
MSRQDCRKLDKVKKKPRFYGFRSALRGTPSTALASSPGGAQGSAAAAEEEAPGNRCSQGSVSGRPTTPLNVAARATGSHMNTAPGRPEQRAFWPIFRLSQRTPD